MKKNRRNNFCLRGESLEARMALAGDVAAAIEGELLTVRGDQLDNQVTIARTGTGNVIVSGQNGTLVNGQASVTFVRRNLNQVDVRTGSGDDSVTLRSLQIANDLNVDLGTGEDRLITALAAPNLVGANVSILGDLGGDTIRLAGITVQEDLYVDGGLGPLNANLSDVNVAKSLTIVGGPAADIVTIARTSAGHGISIETKEGSDRVALTDLSALSLLVNTDANGALGRDQVVLARVSTFEDVGIFTGKGNDSVSMSDVLSGKNITVSTDDGNDRVLATDVVAAIDAVFEGGAGFDVLEDHGIFAGVQKTIKEFESVI